MSVQAISWAKSQRTGSPSRKLLLLALADRADPEGEARLAHLVAMRETELSADAVSSMLRELEAGGFISRVLDEHGLITATLKLPSGI